MLFANVFCFFVLFCVTHDSVCLFVFGFILCHLFWNVFYLFSVVFAI